jgi:predicted metal-dependent enzyme (double-stranded beta helix superfamily)
MLLTSTKETPTGQAQPRLTPAGTCPADLTKAVRAQVRRGLPWPEAAGSVAAVLRAHLPAPAALLPARLRRGNPSGYQSHLLHAEPDGTFSIAVMVWLPGQQTPIHDHVSWCVTAVLAGHEFEEIFALTDDAQALTPVTRRRNLPGTIAAFAPPGDIHRVRNTGHTVAVSLHIYGADISRLTTSIRREYSLPILP